MGGKGGGWFAGLNLSDSPLGVFSDDGVSIVATGLERGQIMGSSYITKNDADIA